MTGCYACDLTSDAEHLPGGRIHQSTHWVVEHCTGPLGVGTLILKPFRHCTHVADLTAEEAVELGPLLQRLTQLVQDLLDPDQVYISLWSHMDWAPVHIHFVIQPIAPSFKEIYGLGGPALQAEMMRRGELPAQSAVEDFCDRARELIAQTPKSH